MEKNIPTEEKAMSRWQVGLRDFVAGTVGGMFQVVVGHPLDTIKVRLQTIDTTPTQHATFRGVWHCARTTVAEEGFRGLYKGMASPLLGVTALNAVLFATYGQVVKHIQKDSNTPLTLNQCAFAGSVAGLVQCVIVGPTELVKSKLQVQYAGSTLYKGPWDCAKKIFRAEGVYGLGRGMSVTIVREVPAYATCFYSYEGLRRFFQGDKPSADDIGPLATIVSGGIAGMVCWTASYPQDVIKSRLQIEPEGSLKYRRNPYLFDGGMIDCWRKTVKAEGYGALWKGFTACMVRAFPANAASFLGYTWTIQTFDALSS